MSVILITTGAPGTGKTYIRCARFLVDEFLINSSGTHYSNFPVNVDAVADAVHLKFTSKMGGWLSRHVFRRSVPSLESIKSRIVIIPDDVIQSWRSEVSGPWDYFTGKDLTYSHVAIDEIHELIHSSSSPEYLKKWDDFLGTIRHRGCNFEGLTQDIARVDRCFTGRAAIRQVLVSCDDMRDPFFKIRVSDWCELKACFTGQFHKSVFLEEFSKQGSGRWKKSHTEKYYITPDYFGYYNSFSANHLEKDLDKSVNDDRAPLYQYQQRTKLGLVFWFLSRNLFSLSWRFFLWGFFLWLTLFGGLSFLINRFFETARNKSLIVSSADLDDKLSDDLELVGSTSDTVVIGDLVPDGGGGDRLEVRPHIPANLVSSGGDESKINARLYEGYKIVLLDYNSVEFFNGLFLSANETFPQFSIYRGLYVKFYDVQNRSVVLSDDTVLRMRQFAENSPANVTEK